MKRRKIWEGVTVTGLADRGKAVGRDPEGRVVFIEDAVPGDVLDVLLLRKKKGAWQGVPEAFISYSADRQAPACMHFEDCGGCKWQHLAYSAQLREKETIVRETMRRIAKVEPESFESILGADPIYHYRNKMEFSFSSDRWKTKAEIEKNEVLQGLGALGLHPPRFFNKVVQLEECWLQKEPSNAIRNFLGSYAQEHGLSYFDPLAHTGFLRNVIIRNTTLDQWMVIISFGHESKAQREALLDRLAQEFPEITSLQYVINQKKNDTLFDQDIISYRGADHLIEQLGHLRLKIRPKSFFQTNSVQAVKLYDIVADFCDLQGEERVYDLYTGTGSIALYLAAKAKTVVGVEEVEDAILDARENAQANDIRNAHFYVGDVRHVFDQPLIARHGSPDVVVVDPPRGGLHERVVQHLLATAPDRIVYVSCNPATQARDIALLKDQYEVLRMRPVDMFPHTSHIENVALLSRR